MQDRIMADLVRTQHPLMMGPDTTVAEACAAMLKRRVGAVLVVEDEDRLVGIFTGRDALKCLARCCDSRKVPLHEVMTRNPIPLEPGQHSIEALRLLDDAGFRHLPICRDGRVSGIVSRYDFRAKEYARLDDETGFFEHMR